MQINPASLMSTLRLLDDAALKQYGEMHKDDPYVLPLVLGEYNARSQVRSAAQAQPAGPQAPVNEQMLAEMQSPTLPEDTGIAAVAPESVAEFASGGIVGYANTGEVKSPYRTRGQDQWEQIKRAATNAATKAGNFLLDQGPLGIASGTGHVVGDLAVGLGQGISNIKGGPKNTFIVDPDTTPGLPGPNSSSAAWDAFRRQRQADLDEVGSLARRYPDPAAEPTVRKLPFKPGVDDAAGTVQNLPYQLDAETARLAKRYPATQNLSQPTGGAPGAPGATPSMPGVTRAAPRAPGAAPAAGGLQSYMDMLNKAAGVDKYRTEMTAEQDRINAAITADAEASQKELEADIAARGKLGEGTEARNKKRDEELIAEKDRAPYEALLEAGLAMMAGESPHAFVNIGKGAMEGTKAYRNKLEKITAARDKLNESMDNLEIARRAEDIGNDRERRAAKSTVRQAKIQGMQAMQSISKAMGFDLTMKHVELAVAAMEKQKDRTNDLQKSRIAAAGAGTGTGSNLKDLDFQRKVLNDQISALEKSRSDLKDKAYTRANKEAIDNYTTLIDALRERLDALGTGGDWTVREVGKK